MLSKPRRRFGHLAGRFRQLDGNPERPEGSIFRVRQFDDHFASFYLRILQDFTYSVYRAGRNANFRHARDGFGASHFRNHPINYGSQFAVVREACLHSLEPGMDGEFPTAWAIGRSKGRSAPDKSEWKPFHPAD